LLIRGALSDIFAPDVAERMIATIPGARLTTVANSGHSVPLDAPEGFLAAAGAFLKG
jgi:pimeloyl-ACP methyl ester carboxylesterase